MWILIILLAVPAFSFNAHISYNDLLECKEFHVNSGYKYTQFFDISKFENNNPGRNEIFRIKFYIMANKDMWILLTPGTNLTQNAHEIGKIGHCLVIQKHRFLFQEFLILLQVFKHPTTILEMLFKVHQVKIRHQIFHNYFH